MVNEVKNALFMMHPSKPLGPNGFHATFYQKYWHIVGRKVTTLALKFLNEGGSLEEVHDPFIVLIPKIINAYRMAYFRLISICNVLYKIIVKTIVNQLKIVLPLVINESQSGLVPDRLITDMP